MKEDEEKLDKNRNKGAIAFTVICIILFSLYYIQENNIDKKFDKCYRITVASPYKLIRQKNMYFTFELNGKKINETAGVSSGDVGLHWNNNFVLEKRFWLKVYCDDFKVNRVIWDIPVPDTLKFIPANGWDKIPYGLDKK